MLIFSFFSWHGISGQFLGAMDSGKHLKSWHKVPGDRITWDGLDAYG